MLDELSPIVNRNSVLLGSQRNPFYKSSFEVGEEVTLSDPEIDPLEVAVDRAFAKVKDQHFADLGEILGLNNQQIISLADFGLNGGAVLSQKDNTSILHVRLLLTTVACPSKDRMKQQIKYEIKNELAGKAQVEVKVQDQYEVLANRMYGNEPEKLQEVLSSLNSFDNKISTPAAIELIKEAAARMIPKYQAGRSLEEAARLATLEVRAITEFQPTWIPIETVTRFARYQEAPGTEELQGSELNFMKYAEYCIGVSSEFWSGNRGRIYALSDEVSIQDKVEVFQWGNQRMRDRPMPEVENPLVKISARV